MLEDSVSIRVCGFSTICVDTLVKVDRTSNSTILVTTVDSYEVVTTLEVEVAVAATLPIETDVITAVVSSSICCS